LRKIAVKIDIQCTDIDENVQSLKGKV